VTWTRVASLDETRAARPWLPLRVAGIDVVLASVGATWFAVEDRCSHAGCAFSEEADLRSSEITCNCHGSQFDIRSGAVLRGPAERPIRTFAVRVAEDGLEMDV
jgi:nitrite reductase/ring-hydroxylating ferredoxin subunit